MCIVYVRINPREDNTMGAGAQVAERPAVLRVSQLPSCQGSLWRDPLMRLALLILAMGYMNSLRRKGYSSRFGP